MASTNKTEKLGLSQYINTDKPTYLVDYNNDMSKIDANAVLTSTSIASNVSAIEANRQSIDTVNGRVDTTNENVTNLTNTVAQNKQDADNKNTEVSERIIQVNKNVQDLEDEFDKFRNSGKDPGTQEEPFKTINANIAINTASIQSNMVEIDSLDKRVEALEEGGGSGEPADYAQLKTNVQKNMTSINALQKTCAPVITSTTIHIGENENNTQISKTELLPVDIVYDDTAKTLGWKEKGADTVNPFKNNNNNNDFPSTISIKIESRYPIGTQGGSHYTITENPELAKIYKRWDFTGTSGGGGEYTGQQITGYCYSGTSGVFTLYQV